MAKNGMGRWASLLLGAVVATKGLATEPPTLISMELLTADRGIAVLRWKTDVPAQVRAEYGSTLRYGHFTAWSTLPDRKGELQIPKLAPGGRYHLRLHCRREAGVDASASRDLVFRMYSGTPPPGEIPLTASEWSAEYGAFGHVQYQASDGLEMSPAVSEAPSETHALLLLARETMNKPLRDFKVTVDVSTVAQLRSGAPPQPWEVFWLYFNRTGHGQNGAANYFLFKINGVELGRAWNLSQQKFLIAKAEPRMSDVGTRHQWMITKRGQSIIVEIDGKLALFYQGTGLPDALYDTPGSIGLYVEDARVHVYSVRIQPL